MFRQPARVSLGLLASGVIVSVATAVAIVLLAFGRLEGGLAYAAGALGGLIAVPVLTAQVLAPRALRQTRTRAGATLLGIVVPWTVAPLAGAVAVTVGDRLTRAAAASLPRAASSATGRTEAIGEGCESKLTLAALAAGRWSVSRTSGARAVLRVELEPAASVALHVTSSNPTIEVVCGSTRARRPEASEVSVIEHEPRG